MVYRRIKGIAMQVNNRSERLEKEARFKEKEKEKAELEKRKMLGLMFKKA